MRILKSHLRATLKERYAVINFQAYEKDLTNNALQYLSTKQYSSIGVFCSLSHEQPTNKLIQELLRNDKKVFLPRMYGNDIKFHQIISTEELVENRFKILEPPLHSKISDDLDVVIVPGLVFDRSGYRLGFGKGCYDKYLSKSNAIKVGYCISLQLTADNDLIPKESHDVALDAIVTDVEILEINGQS